MDLSGVSGDEECVEVRERVEGITAEARRGGKREEPGTIKITVTDDSLENGVVTAKTV